MQNHSFYAFYPSDYDPRNDPTFQLDNGEYDSVIDLRQRLDQIPWAPASERPAFDILFRALREWWRNNREDMSESDNFHSDMLSVGDDYYALANSNYFHLSSTPPTREQDWFLMMINVANDNGLIVFSTPDYTFYYPDRTTTPPNAREWLEEYIATQNRPSYLTRETLPNILIAEKTQNSKKISPYLRRNKDIGSLVVILMEDFLQKHGITDYEKSKAKPDSEWQMFSFKRGDMTIFIRLGHHTYANDHAVEFNPSVQIESNTPSDVFPLVSLMFSKQDYDWGLLELRIPDIIRAKGNKSPEFKQAFQALRTELYIYRVTQLCRAMNDFLDIVEQEVLPYDNLYDFIDAVITGKSKIIHQFIWEIPPRSYQNVYGSIAIAYQVQHPQFQQVMDKGLAWLATNEKWLSETVQETLNNAKMSYDSKRLD